MTVTARRCLPVFILTSACFTSLGSAAERGAAPRHTRVAIDGTQWKINGQVTYAGAPAEGLLMNVRMVNVIFEDRKRLEFDATANTDAFLAKLDDYADAGVLVFTVGLQGGMPGYEGAVNSAYRPDGSLRPSYLRRAKRVIEACDRRGLVVILGCYYQRQDQILEDADAVETFTPLRKDYLP